MQGEILDAERGGSWTLWAVVGDAKDHAIRHRVVMLGLS
jgi:hypothetical protein